MRGRRLALGPAALLAAACALPGTRAPTDVPGPVVVPEIAIEPVTGLLHPDVAYLSPPPDDDYFDPILASAVLRDPEFEEEVAWWIDYWQNAARPWFPDFLRRMGAFERTVDSALAERAMTPGVVVTPLPDVDHPPICSTCSVVLASVRSHSRWKPNHISAPTEATMSTAMAAEMTPSPR